MIGQYLPQTNESATVPKTQKFCQLNKALVDHLVGNDMDTLYKKTNEV
jgi:hypothetical protein